VPARILVRCSCYGLLVALSACNESSTGVTSPLDNVAASSSGSITSGVSSGSGSTSSGSASSSTSGSTSSGSGSSNGSGSTSGGGGSSSGSGSSGSGSSAAGLAIKVSGNHLVDGAGSTIQLRGINISALEFVAIEGWDPGNPWGGQTGDPTPNWSTIKSWSTNAVRLPLNEASWLGSSCVDIGGASVTTVNGQQVKDTPGQVIQADPGNNYQATVKQAVANANAAGIYVILELQWGAPKYGSTAACPTAQNPMADADYSATFWSSVASTFKSNPAVIFELFNEPFVGTSSLASSDTNTPGYYILNGGATETTVAAAGNPSKINLTWTTAGMQQLLNAVRATGATNVVLTSTDAYSSSLSDWLQHMPTDPAGQLGAVWHAYSAAAYGYPTQVTCQPLPQCSATEMSAAQQILAAGHPIVITEFGDVITSAAGNSSPWASVLLPFADKNGISYLGWTWDTWAGVGGNVLITDAAGDPTNGFGTYVKQHYLCVAGGTSNCP
jgi:endoglucanase